MKTRVDLSPMPKYGKLAGHMLELLSAGILLGTTKDRKIRRELFEEADKIWHSFDRKLLHQLLTRAKLYGYVEKIKTSDQEEKYRITARGKSRALEYKFRELKLEAKKKWDKKWRIVLFDIPEPKKKIRDAFRRKLKYMGFLEFQKSVFIYPYPCDDEINFVLNFLEISDHAYYIEAPISPDHNFRVHFKLK